MRKPILHLVFIITGLTLVSCDKEVDPKLNPVVITTEVTSISYNSAQSGGEITDDGGYDVIARGVCWSTSPNPTINDSVTVDGSGIGAFNSNMSGLKAVTNYFLRAYSTNSQGTFYGNEVKFTTLSTIPEVITAEIDSITFSSAISGGEVVNDGGNSVYERGIIWSTSPDLTTSDCKTVDGIGVGSYTSMLSNLISGTTYYVKAYATNSVGIGYGSQKSFTTLGRKPIFIEKFSNNSQGSFTIVDVVKPADANYIWTPTQDFGMAATAFIGGSNRVSESWLISPEISLADVSKVSMTFDHALNFLRGASAIDFATVWISTTYLSGSPSNAAWTQLTIPSYPSGNNWSFISSGAVSLEEFVGEPKVRIAFKYVSSLTTTPTWEIKNLVVREDVD